MSRYFHQLIAYGVGAFSFFTLGLAVDRMAEAMPFVAQVHALPKPKGTEEFDQHTVGGRSVEKGKVCATHTRILIRSDHPLDTLQTHYANHTVPAANGEGRVAGKVRPAAKVSDLNPKWHVHREDPKVFVVDFHSPGSPGTEAACLL